MYKGFNLVLDELGQPLSDISPVGSAQLVAEGESLFNEHSQKVRRKLQEYENGDGKLSASDIIADWFPMINADVFLSHAHKDSKDVLALAGWLKVEFGLTSFIDSTVWGYSDELLRMIDNTYCRSAGEPTYDYNKRNRSTSHVHLMLSTALMNMMDRTEAVIFVNTPQAFKPTEYFDDKGSTESPWIYNELCMTRYLRKKELTRPVTVNKSLALDGVAMAMEARNLQIQYEVDIQHLRPIDAQHLIEWKDLVSSKRGAATLDYLYYISGRR